MSSIWAIVPAAGSGRRMAAEIPKQYLSVGGLPILEHTLRALLACSDIRGVVVVLDPSDRRADSLESLSDPRVNRAAGGAERVDSVLAGLKVLMTEASWDDWVLVHDAARPCLPVTDLKRLIKHVEHHNVGAILAQPSVDTIKRVNSKGRVVKTLDRTKLWRAQTPQMFRLRDLHDALVVSLSEGLIVTDEASAMELQGHTVHVVEGPASNIKVTIPEDLELAALYLQSKLETER